MGRMASPDPVPGTADLLVSGAKLVATCDGERRELAGGWIAITNGLISGVGSASDPVPAASSVLDASGCLVTPGLVNTHHHIYQNLTRAYGPAVNGTLFEWLTTLYPLWAALDSEAAYLSAWVGLAELALGGCTTTTDHLYVAPRGGGDLWTASITAARELGMRFHPTRGSMTVSEKDGGLPPDSVVQDDDEVLASSERLVKQHHDPSWGAMVRIALAPCSPFSVSPGLMRRTAELAEQLDVRLHTHLAEDADEDTFCLEKFGRRPVEQFEEVGWLTSRSWVAHCIYPNQAEVERLGAAGVGVAHCPSSNMILGGGGGGGFAPVRELRAAGSPVGLGCDGSSSADSASLWTEARAALLLGRQRGGPAGMAARDVLEIATRGGASCLGRSGEIGELTVGAVGDVVCWPASGIRFAGALTDPVEAWLRCGPLSAQHTVVAGEVLVRDGVLTAPGVAGKLREHATAAARIQRLTGLRARFDKGERGGAGDDPFHGVPGDVAQVDADGFVQIVDRWSRPAGTSRRGHRPPRTIGRRGW
jgi:cytosine/adenosine deaminase-related metal-dependent hydrolase